MRSEGITEHGIECTPRLGEEEDEMGQLLDIKISDVSTTKSYEKWLDDLLVAVANRADLTDDEYQLVCNLALHLSNSDVEVVVEAALEAAIS